MSFYRLARPARTDLLAIAVRSAEGWGAQHAANYMAGLFGVFEQLAVMPGFGRACDHIRPGLHRIEHGAHVVFYRRRDEGGIRIVRVLGAEMEPRRHLTVTDEAEDP